MSYLPDCQPAEDMAPSHAEAFLTPHELDRADKEASRSFRQMLKAWHFTHDRDAAIAAWAKRERRIYAEAILGSQFLKDLGSS